MPFDVGTVSLKVSEEVPALKGLPFPDSSHELSSRELANFLNGEAGWGGDLEISPARDWTNYVNE